MVHQATVEAAHQTTTTTYKMEMIAIDFTSRQEMLLDFDIHLFLIMWDNNYFHFLAAQKSNRAQN